MLAVCIVQLQLHSLQIEELHKQQHCSIKRYFKGMCTIHYYMCTDGCALFDLSTLLLSWHINVRVMEVPLHTDSFAQLYAQASASGIISWPLAESFSLFLQLACILKLFLMHICLLIKET